MEIKETISKHLNLPPALWNQMVKEQKKNDRPSEYLRPLLGIIAEELYRKRTLS